MSTSPLILASSSPRRLTLLQDIGIVPSEVVPADIDETQLAAEQPRDLALRLAVEKSTAVAKRRPDAFVLAADTVVAIGRRVLPKAETAQHVRHCLAMLEGRRHHVYTGVALTVPGGKTITRLSDNCVLFRQLSKLEIEQYVLCNEGIGKAGGYAIQGMAAALIRFISGSHSGIIGLPLCDVMQMLDGTGWKRS